MLNALFGNPTAAKALLFIGNNGDAYAQEISNKLDVARSLVQAQLDRLEVGGVLVSRPRGRMRFYSFNPRWPFANALKSILCEAVDYMPAKDQDLYIVRRRPRMRGKPL